MLDGGVEAREADVDCRGPVSKEGRVVRGLRRVALSDHDLGHGDVMEVRGRGIELVHGGRRHIIVLEVDLAEVVPDRGGVGSTVVLRLNALGELPVAGIGYHPR